MTTARRLYHPSENTSYFPACVSASGTSAASSYDDTNVSWSSWSSCGGETPPRRLVVLDWDDTCCPSSWIASSPGRGRDADAGEMSALRDVEAGIAAVLQTAEGLGCAVAIITNADEAWVRFSCARFLPRVAPLLAGVRVVSARHYEGRYPGRSVCWKAAAFTYVAKAFFLTDNNNNNNERGVSHCGGGAPHAFGEGPDASSGAADSGGSHSAQRDLDNTRTLSQWREIISIGDSNDERLAVRAAAAPLGATPKAIKLVDSPRLVTVARQLMTVATCLPFVLDARVALDVDLAAILHYVHRAAPAGCGVVPREAASEEPPETVVLRRVWRDAARAVLTAIRVQSLARADAGTTLTDDDDLASDDRAAASPARCYVTAPSARLDAVGAGSPVSTTTRQAAPSSVVVPPLVVAAPAHRPDAVSSLPTVALEA